MGMDLTFLPYTAGDSDAIEIYRADRYHGPRKKIATLPPGTHAYSDPSTTPKNIYWYWILNKSAIEGDKLSRPMSCSSFTDTGPGHGHVVRGSWEFGYMGFVPLAEMVSYVDIKTQLSLTMDISNPDNLTGYHKCAINGKIIYIGNALFNVSCTKADIGDILIPMGADAKDVGKKVVTHNGKLDHTFIVRPPYSSTQFTTELTNQTEMADDSLPFSEVAMLALLEDVAGSNNQLFGNYRMGDRENNGLTTYYFTNTYAQTNTVHVFSLLADASIGPASDMAGRRPFWPVLELVL